VSIRVLIADDHAVVREGLKLYLDMQEDIEVIGEAADGDEVIERSGAIRPDVVLMDLVMPGTDGVAATARIKEEHPEIHVVVLTSVLEDDSIRSALRAGATGYLLKDAPPADVAEAIRTVHQGTPLLHGDVLRRLVDHFAATAGVERGPGGPAGTMTIAFTDIENSAALVREFGDEGARPIFRTHDDTVRDVVQTHGGREVQHLGDGFMLAFAGARAAVGCAIDIQRAFARRDESAVRVRIGMHTGEVIPERHGYFGEAVWLAARIASKAEGGQILVSDLTRQLVGSACACRDKGEFTLKGLPGVHRLYEVSWHDATVT
jgi:DNA-binding NarL/FixJ family response regulator